MPLYWFLLVVVSLGCGSVPANEVPALRAVIATAGVLLAWGVLAKVAALMSTVQLSDQPADPVAIVRVFERQISFLRWLGIPAIAMCLIGFGLVGVIDSLAISQHSMALRAGMMMTPGILIVALVWWADHQFGVANDLTRGGLGTAIAECIAEFRMQGAWLVIPVLSLLGLIDLLLLIPGIPVAASSIAVVVVALLVVPIGMPWLAQRIWSTEPLSAGPHAWLQEIGTATGVQRLSMRRWHTGFKSSNALVAGFLPGCRVMLLTDRLLDRLPDAQLAMIALHEIAHLRRWHVPMRMLAIVPAWGAVWLVHLLLADFGFAWSEAIGIGCGVATSLSFLHVVSHRTELDADATACRLALQAASSVGGVPATLGEAARAMSDSLDSVTADAPHARRGTWLHPSVSKRQAALAKLVATVPDIPNDRRDPVQFGFETSNSFQNG